MSDQHFTPDTQTILSAYKEHGRSDGPAGPEQRRTEFFRWLTVNDDDIRTETRGNLTSEDMPLGVVIHDFQQRVHRTEGTVYERRLLTSVTSIHATAQQMAQPDWGNLAYSEGNVDMVGTVLHLMKVSLTGASLISPRTLSVHEETDHS